MSVPPPATVDQIDAHQHFWKYSAEDYGWIDDSMARIRRDFGPSDLLPNLKATGLAGCVSVQARQTLEESAWLVELSKQHSFIRAVVGWVPLVSPGVRGDLERLSAAPAFKGVRHVVQGEPDGFLDVPEFNAGIREVTSMGLTYDVLIFARQLDQAIRFIDRHPEQRFVLDHIAKPLIAGLPDSEWRRHVRDVARRENVSCKFSGVVTEVQGWAWTPELLRPYFDVVLDAFGSKRLMFGSDWPVCLVATEYERWVNFVRSCTRALSPDEQEWIFGRSAAEAYRMSDASRSTKSQGPSSK